MPENARPLDRLAPEALLTTPAELARAELQREVVERYAEAMRDGAEFPAVVVFTDGQRFWLADGFHRLEAHKAARDGEPIRIDQREGTELDAVRFALAANVDHGLARSGEDLRRAFAAAVRRQLVDPTDAAATQALLSCSTAAAYKLTADARRAAKAERDQRINDLRAAGESQRAIADEIGVGQATVSAVIGNSHEKNRSSPPVRRAERQPDNADSGRSVRSNRQPASAPAPPPRRETPLGGHVPPGLDRLADLAVPVGKLSPVRAAAELPVADQELYARRLANLHDWLGQFLLTLDGRRGKPPQVRM